MSARTPAEALTAAVSLLVDGPDAVGTLNALADTCATALAAGAVGILVSDLPPSPFALDLLAASSHEAASLELYQVQTGAGPCYDAITTGADVSVVGAEDLTRRWPRLAPVLVAAGLDAAHAWPLHWHGTAFGALNLFMVARELTAEERSLARGFADVAAAAIAYADEPRDIAQVIRAVRATMDERAVLEQAKGVVRQLLDADEGEAFAVIARRARAVRSSVTAVAREVLAAAEAGWRPAWLTR